MHLEIVDRIAFWLIFVFATSLFIRRAVFLLNRLRSGKEYSEPHHFGKRIRETVVDVFFQRCNSRTITRKDLAGLGHMLIFWGFIIFSLSYAVFIFIDEGLGPIAIIRNTQLYKVLSYLVDIVGIFVFFAVIWAILRRYAANVERLERSVEAGVILAMIVLLIVLHYMVGGLKVNLDGRVVWTPVAFLSATLYNWIGIDSSSQHRLLTIFWWLHYVILLSFLVYIPYSKHLHILAAPLNSLFKPFRSSGDLMPVRLDKMTKWGANQVREFTWKHLLDTYACTECGRCEISCPAFLSGKPLSPKKLVRDLRNNLLGDDLPTAPSNSQEREQGHFPFLSNNRDLHTNIEMIHSCTTCGACIETCPAYNRPMDLVLEMKRSLVYEGIFDNGHKVALQRTFRYGNPNAVTEIGRENALSILGLDKANEREEYDLLYWLGCSTYFDDRSQDIAKALIRIVRNAGLKIAALGSEECCCGDFARRVGDEGLFQKLAFSNIEKLQKYQFTKLVTHCPHGFNTFKNEYTKFGAAFEIVHHCMLIRDIMKARMIDIKKIIDQVVYHDPCYLGRHNCIYEPPRALLSRIAERQVEFTLSRNRSFCCGAGGGHIWKHEEVGTRINDLRIEQALDTGVKTVVTACPFCLAMLEDSILIKGIGPELEVKDIAELVEQALC